MPPTQPSRQPPNAETIIISFLCGSLALSFILAALAAVLKVYPRSSVIPLIKRVLAKLKRAPPPPAEQPEGQPEVQQMQELPVQAGEVQLVDAPFDFGLREDVERRITYPPPAVPRM